MKSSLGLPAASDRERYDHQTMVDKVAVCLENIYSSETHSKK
jgi:hypothetical protein